MENGIANQILCAQANIDRMRQEIIQVVSMVLGYIKPNGTGVVQFPSNSDCIWKITIEQRENGSDYYGYDISPRCYSRDNLSRVLFSKDAFLRTPALISPEDMVTVHASLDSFVEEVCSCFPEVREKIETFLKAGKI